MQISIQHLNKFYDGFQALREVNLELESGMFGLLGPNGAGKSTLMKILATLEKPSSGKIAIDGADIRTHRRMIRSSLGYLPQFFGVYPQLTGAEFLLYIAKLNHLTGKHAQTRALQMLENVGLKQARDRKVKTYSGGMLRRLGIAQALIHDPRLLIVDEPTVGLDPEERIRFRNLLTEISRDKIIILSTHIVGDISSTCEDIALLAHGEVVFRGQPAALIAKATDKVWLIECSETEFAQFSESMSIISTIQKPGKLLLRAVGERPPEGKASSAQPNLEDAYMYFMESIAGEKLDESELRA